MAIPHPRWSNDAPYVDFPIAFERTLPHGLCVGVSIPPDEDEISPAVLARLHADEARHAATLRPPRRDTWIAGRLALRAALQRMGIDAAAILPNHRGAPAMPPGMVGSISHTRTTAVALVAEDTGWAIGVDIERNTLGRQDISRHVLTEPERAEVARLPPEQRGPSIMQRFSLKESIYKAIDPFLQRYVRFREVAVTPLDQGRVAVEPRLEHGGPLEIEAWWSTGDTFVLSSARARPRCAAPVPSDSLWSDL